MKQTKKRKTKTRFGQALIKSLREFAEQLQSCEDIETTFRCRRVEVDVASSSYDPEAIKETRGMLKASQTVFAGLLGVSAQTVRAWEQGQNTPSPIAKRFIDEIRHDPDYWRARLREVIEKKRLAASKPN
jgi:DNA-binding transcriptional regulator YiaG